MTTKNADPKGSNGQSLPVVMEVVKTNEPKKPEKQQQTVEELEKKIQELTARLNTIPKDFSARIEYFNHKRELIRRHAILEQNAENLRNHLLTLSEVAARNDFESDEFSLSIEGGSKYSKKQVFALQNPVLIGDVINFLLGKIEAKADNIKNQIEA